MKKPTPEEAAAAYKRRKREIAERASITQGRKGIGDAVVAIVERKERLTLASLEAELKARFAATKDGFEAQWAEALRLIGRTLKP